METILKPAETPKPKRNKSAWIISVFRHPIVIGGYYLSVIVAAISFDAIQSSFNSQTFIIAAILLATLIFLVIAVSALFFRIGRQNEFEDRISDMKEFINAQHMGWIVNDKYIRALEFGSKNTWVFTRNLVNDLDQDGEIYQAVKSNLELGNSYIYFIPDTPSSYEIINKYTLIHKFKSQQVAFYLIPELQYTFYTEVVVYNVGDEERMAIEWLPQDDLNYYIAMGKTHTDYLIGTGRMYKSKFENFLEKK